MSKMAEFLAILSEVEKRGIPDERRSVDVYESAIGEELCVRLRISAFDHSEEESRPSGFYGGRWLGSGFTEAEAEYIDKTWRNTT